MVWEVRSTGSDTLCSGGCAAGALTATPAQPAVTGSASGGTVAAGTYYVVVTHQDQYGETSASPEKSVTLTGATSSFTVTAPTNAASRTAWNVYVGTASGGPYWPQGTALVLGTDRVVTTTPPTSGTQAPGTDYSQSDSAHTTLGGGGVSAVVAATTTNLTLTGYTATAADVGNTVAITGGTATAGIYQIVGFSGSNTWVLDRSAGTAAQTATGPMGGGFATWGKALSSPTALVVGNTVWIKSATYTLTTALSLTVGSSTLINVRGYQTTRGDTGTRPLLTTATNSTNLILSAGLSGYQFTRLAFSNTAATRSVGINATSGGANNWRLSDCTFDGFTVAIEGNFNVNYNLGGIIDGCEFKNQSGAGKYVDLGGPCLIHGCYFHDNAGTAIEHSNIAQGGVLIISRNIFKSNNHDIVVDVKDSKGPSVSILHNSFALTTGDSVQVTLTGASFVAIANIFSTVGAYAIRNTNAAPAIPCALVAINAFYGSVSGNFQNIVINPGQGLDQGTNYPAGTVLLTADPFTNAAGGDFSLNTTAGGGAACRATSVPGAWPGASTTGYPDIGAVQHGNPTSTDPGIANVRSGTTYTINDASLTGTMAAGVLVGSSDLSGGLS